MSTSYKLLVLSAEGVVSDWAVSAATEDDARRQVGSLGYSVLTCRQVASRPSLATPVWFRSPNVNAVSFAQDLATLLDAGISIRESVATLARRAGSSSDGALLRRLEESIAQGLRLSAAMNAGGGFPALLIATVAASEQTGDLAIGLARFGKHQQSLRSLRDKVLGACVYPALLLVFGSLVLMVLLGVVVPRFALVLDVSSRQLPALSKLLMAWGAFANEHATATPLMFALVLGLLASTAFGLSSSRRRHWLLDRIPGASKLAVEFQHLQVYRATAILTSRGIPIQRALEYTTDYLGPRSRSQLEQGLIAIREGLPISAALSRTGFADEMVSSMLGVAERSGAIPEMLDRIADLHERSLQRNVDIASRLIEPLLMIVFGVLIGGIVLLMYLPIFDLASSVT